MSQSTTLDLGTRRHAPPPGGALPDLHEGLERMGIRAGRPETLPFGPGDVTAGSESELQTVVLGDHQTADLPRAVAESGFFANVSRRGAEACSCVAGQPRG